MAFLVLTIFLSGASAAPELMGREYRASERAYDVGSTRREVEADSRSRAWVGGASHSVRLPSLPPETFSPWERRTLKPGVPLQVGVPRDLPFLETPASLRSALHWQPLSGGGYAARIQLTSPGAQALRLGLRVARLPAALELGFFAPDEVRVFAVSGAEIMHRVEIDGSSGGSGEAAGMYWSPVIDGDTVIMELHLSPEANVEELEMGISQLSHLQVSPGRGFVGSVGSAAACQVDVVCDTEWLDTRHSVARMVFTESGSSFLCTGTLLTHAEMVEPIPYFLSANHCISTQTVASTLDTFWFFEATACGSGALSPSYRQLSGGATLLYQSEITDISFMRLNSRPPVGVVFAGWTSAVPTPGVVTTGIHHPRGDLKKINSGSLAGFASCTSTMPSFSCVSADGSQGDYLRAEWYAGVVEAGSSGSGLWQVQPDTGNRYLVGVLRGGSSSCARPGNPDYYGRFDVAYRDALHEWLRPSLAPTPLEDPRSFVEQQYRDFLGREGDAGGIDYWTGELEAGRLTRAQVADVFFRSTEFQNGIAPLARLYFAYFNRIPDYAGLQFWVQAFQSGGSLDAMSQAFADSPEFLATYGALDDGAFVDLVYWNVLGRLPDAGGRAFWIGELAAGMSRGALMIGFSEFEEYRQRSFQAVQVTMMYVSMLRRTPEQGGFDYWVAELAAGGSILELIGDILDSTEYGDRFTGASAARAPG